MFDDGSPSTTKSKPDGGEFERGSIAATNGQSNLTEVDVEKFSPTAVSQYDDASPTSTDHANQASTGSLRSSFKRFKLTLLKYNLEAHGIQRVLPSQRHSPGHQGLTQIGLLWFSVNLAANNITLGMLGPAVFYLPFLDCALCAVFGMLIGCLPVAYIATFGPRSGNRTMILTRYITGWWPSKLIVVLTLIIFIGYSLIDVVIAGQILSAVSANNNLSIVVGIIITAVITWLVTTFGYSIFHFYERYAWLPQLIVTMILAGVAGPKFDLYSNPSAGVDKPTLVGNRLSFLSLCLAAAITYAPGAADFFVYYPENTPATQIFSITVLGLTLSFTPMFVLGIGLGSGIATNADWADAYETSQGALIVEGYRPLGSFGSLCGVVVALGLISNLVAPTYASGIDWQALGRYFEKVPRAAWTTFSVVVYTVCAVAGRAELAAIFTNFLAIMGYFVCIWIAIVLEEHLIFRKHHGKGWNWEDWNNRSQLPIGIAALTAFLVGWVGAILCMAQVWYVGPIAASDVFGKYGGDLGNYVGFLWAAIVYPPLRLAELKRFGR